ncbi:hypothetical protein HAX54_043270 [Datura stramonium]|uniref:Uncharacterized protein n=1 Tax=Datura stramonium TaxID=4076 RepID=A0ABS8W312_DATST|nr:hypothetical protein [Datura stramonium]
MAQEPSSVPSLLSSPDHRYSSKGNQDPLLFLEDLILDTPISSNPPPSPTPFITRKSSNPKRLVLTSEALSSQNPHPEGDDFVQAMNFSGSPVSTTQDDFSIKKPKDDESGMGNTNVIPSSRPVVSYAETRVLEKKGLTCLLWTSGLVGVGRRLHREKRNRLLQRWDGTPTPYVPVEDAFLIPVDDEVPVNLVFSRKPRTSSKLSSKSKKGTKGGPVSQGTTKRLQKLEGSHVGAVRQSTRENKWLYQEEPSEEPSATAKKSKGKSVVKASSKGKRTVSKEPSVLVSLPSLDAHLGERIENIRKQKVLGGRIFDHNIVGMHGM